MTTKNHQLLSAYHRFVVQASKYGYSIDRATPELFEVYNTRTAQDLEGSQPENLRHFLDECVERLGEQQAYEEQMQVAREVMKDHYDVLRKLAE